MIRMFKQIYCALFGHRGLVWLSGEQQNFAECERCCAKPTYESEEVRP